MPTHSSLHAPGYAVVTGGGSGIGKAFCRALTQQGWSVAVADCDVIAAQQTANELVALAGPPNAMPAHLAHLIDVANRDHWQGLLDRLQQAWPRLDLLVNNAGTLITGALDQCPPDQTTRLLEINLLGTIYGCQTLLPWLKQSRAPAQPTSGYEAPPKRPRSNTLRPGVINVASIFGTISPSGFAAYNASKAGVVALTESLRGELQPFDLNATVALPGVTPTQLFSRASFLHEREASLCDRFVRESVITPEQVAETTLRAATRGQLYAVIGRRSRWLWHLKRLAPATLIDQIGRRAAQEFNWSPHRAAVAPPHITPAPSPATSATPTGPSSSNAPV